jgi:hypothetical protein
MKVSKVKRLIYSKLGCSEVIYGGVEYDGNLSDENILGSVHELGKTEWLATNWVGPGDKWEEELWLVKPDPKNPEIKYPVYRICVDTFYKYEKTWWDTFCEYVKRILRI